MSDQITDIVIPILRNLQADVADMKSDIAQLKFDVAELKSDVSMLKVDVSMLKEAVRRIDTRVGAIDSFMASFHATLHWHGDELGYQKDRISALEMSIKRFEGLQSKDSP